MTLIDLNADLGEKIGDDHAMLQLISSANVACGFHAGDPHHIGGTLAAAAAAGVTVGAHPSYNDRAGFGRRFMDYSPAELTDDILYQIGALDALARRHGTRVSYVKPHGAVYNRIVYDEVQARAVIDAVAAFGDLPVMLLPGAVAGRIAEERGLRVIHEAFADRAYTPEGTLVPRSQEGAVLHEPDQVAQRVVQMVTTGTFTAIDGTPLRFSADSVCVHGDSPGAVAMTQAIVQALGAAGVTIRSFL